MSMSSTVEVKPSGPKRAATPGRPMGTALRESQPASLSGLMAMASSRQPNGAQRVSISVTGPMTVRASRSYVNLATSWFLHISVRVRKRPRPFMALLFAIPKPHQN